MNLKLAAEIEVLVGLGLTSCQARIYAALCHAGDLDAKELSQYAHVPRPDIYRIIEDLMKNGLVNKILSRPTTFRAIELRKGISILLAKRNRETKKLEKNAKNILETFHKIDLQAESRKTDFVLLPNAEQVDNQIEILINGTQQFIDCICSWKRFPRINTFKENLKSAWSKGVKCRFVIENPPADDKSNAILNTGENDSCLFRFIPRIPQTVMTIYDKQKAIIITDPKMGSSNSSAMFIQNPSLLNVLTDYFEILWITGMEQPQYNLDAAQEQL
jgi:sugar-specific transcriptional regulator TrmB